MLLKIFNHLILLAFIFLSGSQNIANARRGGSCGGGGNVVRLTDKNKWILLDRLSLEPSLLQESKLPIYFLRTHEQVSTEAEFSLLNENDNAAKSHALARLNIWKFTQLLTQKKSLILVSKISSAIKRMSFIRTKYNLRTMPQYHLDENVLKQNPQIRTAILYSPNYYGAFISSTIWDQLDLDTKAGLIIHEALRQIQGAYQYDDLSDESLQKIAATLIDVSPSTSVSLEKFMSPRLLRFCTLASIQLPKNPAELIDDNGDVSDILIEQSTPGSFVEQIIDQEQLNRVGHLINNETDRQYLVKQLKEQGILE